MGSAELGTDRLHLTIFSHIITYGNGANPEITEQMHEEIEMMWNEPEVSLEFNGLMFIVIFRITSSFQPNIQPIEIYQNTDPKNNYFRVEEFAHGNISFVDGLGCNSGYFKLENLYKGSTTVAHEYGHSLDIRGEGIPGIMYPRGTLVDPPFQYDPTKPAGVTGGTMHPMYRKVKKKDIEHLKLQRLIFENNKAVVGEFTNIYHWNHADIPPEEFTRPAISG